MRLKHTMPALSLWEPGRRVFCRTCMRLVRKLSSSSDVVPTTSPPKRRRLGLGAHLPLSLWLLLWPCFRREENMLVSTLQLCPLHRVNKMLFTFHRRRTSRTRTAPSLGCTRRYVQRPCQHCFQAPTQNTSTARRCWPRDSGKTAP